MATLIRYTVRFAASCGLYNAGEVATLSAEDYQKELRRKPAPLIDLIETLEDELNSEGKQIAGRQKRTPAPPKAPPADVAGKDAEIASLKAKLQAAQERNVLGSDPEKEKLAKSVAELGEQKAELEKKLAQAVEEVSKRDAELAELRAKGPAENREKTPPKSTRG